MANLLDDMHLDDRIALQYEVEQFLFEEAAMLDERRYEDWLKLLTDDIHYWMPIRRTTTMREVEQEFTAPGNMAFFDDDLAQLKLRIQKITSGNAWSEDPPSRTRHFVTNIRITNIADSDTTVELNFHLYRTRLESNEDSWIGRRQDVLRRVNERFMRSSSEL